VTTGVKRVLVGLFHTELGGSQLNALDLATAVRARGYDVHVFASYSGRQPGPVADMVRDRRFQLTLLQTRLPFPRRCAIYRPRVVSALMSAVDTLRIDLLHMYEQHLILDGYFGPFLQRRTPLIGTVYSMGISRWMPRNIPLIAGTHQIVHEARVAGRVCTLMEPPVDTDTDDPSAIDGTDFRRRFEADTLYVIVSRLHSDMKQEGIERAIEAMHVLPGQLVVVGDGPARAAITARAERLNAAVGRPAVVIYGPLDDPRPAYAAADVILGMGSSALRALAFAKPLIVLGIGGFSLECTPETVSHFFREGFYGVGDGRPAPLSDQLRHVLSRKTELAVWGRRTILERYSLRAAAEALDHLYQVTAAQPRRAVLRAASRTGLHKFAAEALPDTLRQRLSPLVRGCRAASTRCTD